MKAYLDSSVGKKRLAEELVLLGDTLEEDV